MFGLFRMPRFIRRYIRRKTARMPEAKALEVKWVSRISGFYAHLFANTFYIVAFSLEVYLCKLFIDAPIGVTGYISADHFLYPSYKLQKNIILLQTLFILMPWVLRFIFIANFSDAPNSVKVLYVYKPFFLIELTNFRKMWSFCKLFVSVFQMVSWGLYIYSLFSSDFTNFRKYYPFANPICTDGLNLVVYLLCKFLLIPQVSGVLGFFYLQTPFFLFVLCTSVEKTL